MGNVNEYVKRNECTGCGACANKCNRNAITMRYDEEGFLSPFVDLSKCNGCSKCIYACPMVFAKYDGKIIKTYIAQNASEEDRLKSSSGGIFSIIARYVIKNGGYVAGTIMNKDFQAETILSNKIDDIALMQGSKYMQSDTKFVFRDIKKLLDEKIYVFYCSTPCQIAGLRTFLDKDYENLLTADLICHGGSAPGLFKKYLNEFYGPVENIESYSFRDKKVFGWSTEANVYFKDGSEKHIKRDRDYWFKAFLPCINVRETCGNCKFAKNPRQGDLTLADFWGVRRVDEKYDDGKGTSLILVNTDNGTNILKNIKSEFGILDEIDYQRVLKFGQPIEKSFKCHPARKRFFELNKINSFEKSFEYSVSNKYDVGIVGVWSGANFGSALTYYALYKVISSFGLSVLLIEVPTNDLNSKVNINHTRKFISNFCKTSRRYLFKEIKSLNNNIDTFITGSDQLWNYGIAKKFGKFFYLDFVNRNCKKISYSTSFGHAVDFAPDSEREAISYLLNDFDAISVREKDGETICKEIYKVKQDVTTVLDPVFLMKEAEYDKLSRLSLFKEKNYVLFYILDFTDNSKSLIEKYISTIKDKTFILLTDAGNFTSQLEEFCKINNIIYKYKIRVVDFVYLFKNAETVVTDSFHGSCFSIIFKKELAIILNRRRGPSRIKTLIDTFDINDCVCTESINPSNKYIENYKMKIINLREKSLNFLKTSIYAPKKVKELKVWQNKY